MGLMNAIGRSLRHLEPVPDLGDEVSQILSSLRNAGESLMEAADTVLTRSQTKPFIHDRCGFCGKDLAEDEREKASGSRIEVSVFSLCY